MVESAISSAGVSVEDVAAVVGGRIVTQEQVDSFILSERTRNGYADDAAWHAYLASAGLSEWDVRAGVIKGMVDNVLVEIEAQRLGVDVSERTARRIDSLSSLYPSHEAFVEAVEDRSYTEEGYRDAVYRNLLWNALRDAVIPTPEPTDDQIRQYAVVVAPTLVGRRSSQIVFANDDYATAVDVLERLQNGADFSELARLYSIDSTAASGGDVGWDCLNTLMPACQAALDDLEPGEISGIVRTNFGYHIIKCTDKYDVALDANGDIDIAAIPAELMDAIVQSMQVSLTTQLFDQYMANLEATVPIAVFNERGEQVDPAEIGLAVEESGTVDNVDEAVAEVQSAVQDAVEQGTAVIKISVAALSSERPSAPSGTLVQGKSDAAGVASSSEIDPVAASAENPSVEVIPSEGRMS